MSLIAPELKPFSQRISFEGGLNLRDSRFNLRPNELRAAENVDLDERGTVRKRLGILNKGALPIAGSYVFNTHVFTRPAGSQFLMHIGDLGANGGIYYTNDPEANPIVWTKIANADPTSPAGFETYNGVVYFGDGVSAYGSWNGTTYTSYGGLPKGKYLRAWRDQMYISGIPGFPDRVYQSNAGDPTVYGISAWIDIDKGMGGPVMGLGDDGNNLVVFKQSRIRNMYDPATFANRIVDASIGCESHLSILPFEGALFFLSRQGIYRLQTAPMCVSTLIEPIFRSEVINLGALDKVYGYVYNNRLGWGLPEIGFTYPTIQVELYPRLASREKPFGPWMIQRMAMGPMSRWRSGANDHMFGGGAHSSLFFQAYTPGNGMDNAVVYQALAETGPQDLGSLHQTKYLRRLKPVGAGRLLIQVFRDFESQVLNTLFVDLSQSTDLWDTADRWGSGVWGPDAEIKIKTVNADEYGRVFQLRFLDAEPGIVSISARVGSSSKKYTAGAWALESITLDGEFLGVRE